MINYSGDYLSQDLFDAENVALSAAKLENGKSPGFDGLTSEHLTNCHPIIYSILARLFNMMLCSSYVPAAFGTGITIPIPKNDCTRGAQKIESFRGITLSPVISKVFEHCILSYFARYLTTSDNQFAFKAKVGCSHAIYTLKTVIEEFVINGTTVSLGFLDMAKAFDKVCHHVLLTKLMKRKLSAALIQLFEHWYNIAANIVRWGVALLQPYRYRLTSEVKQGSVISPTLFALYVVDMLLKLQNMDAASLDYI